ncbi:uncharacterized protein LOC106865939 [Brachypodium distachyon]|uniref:F-box/LRR-repeat protein 15/At3g58940/PEG3-like LRR domain-containing protein n=1 Tax=Brachypodium distachyon TaxID=15368 RepID=A0A2K2DBG6_BRADI|nr:uncharacterized protein LOC106865939 [Brachypodium distachyon]PNT71623.1 hypothetical protein BRADI_2g32582v3 [Brachypodium distachyon]|eukprot:XP_014753498.1 uncharacterized protein LOC106865939 [Brachypodium distachyon]
MGSSGADPTTRRRLDKGPVVEGNPPRLLFAVGAYPWKFPAEDAPAFIFSIDDALARHADVLESLEISLVFRCPSQLYIPSLGKYVTEHPHAALIRGEQVRAWLRHGMARVLRSFVLEVPPCPPPATTNRREKKSTGNRNAGAAAAREDREALALPSTALADTMALTLGDAALSLPVPSEAEFLALRDLLLSNARINEGRRLGELLSSPSCPLLRRLRLEHLVGMEELELQAEKLEELTIMGARNLYWLEVDAPYLRRLCVTECLELESNRGHMAITANVLEALTCSNICKMQELQFDAPSVRVIEKLPLWTHGHADHVARNAAAISILNHCPAARRLSLHLHVPDYMRELIADVTGLVMVDFQSILVDDIPELRNITSLTVTISTWKGHSYAAGLAKLIAQCINLERLSIHVRRGSLQNPSLACLDQNCVCNGEDGWKNQQISLQRLQSLDFTGGQGLKYEKRLGQMIFDAAGVLDKVRLP